MNAAHQHLLANHLPVLGTLFCAALLAVALFLRDVRFQRISFAFLVLVALGGAIAFRTGDEAADLVERLGLPGFPERAIHEHEEAAEAAYLLMNGIGVACFMALLFFRKATDPPPWASLAILLLTLIAFGLFVRASWLGGQIRHTEIRSTAVLSHPTEERGT